MLNFRPVRPAVAANEANLAFSDGARARDWLLSVGLIGCLRRIQALPAAVTECHSPS